MYACCNCLRVQFIYLRLCVQLVPLLEITDIDVALAEFTVFDVGAFVDCLLKPQRTGNNIVILFYPILSCVWLLQVVLFILTLMILVEYKSINIAYKKKGS